MAHQSDARRQSLRKLEPSYWGSNAKEAVGMQSLLAVAKVAGRRWWRANWKITGDVHPEIRKHFHAAKREAGGVTLTQRLVKASGQEKEEVAAKISAHKKFPLRELEVIPKDPANRAGSARI
jgi:hypothetical protein